MIDPFTLALIGAAAGGTLNAARGKDPMKGALIGGALGAGGGLLGAAAGPGAMSGLLGGSSAAAGTAGAAGAAGTAGTAGAGSAGLLAGAETAGALGTNLGSQQTAMLAAQDAAFGGSAAAQGMNPAWATAKGAFNGANQIAKPVGTAVSTAATVKSLMPQDKPMQIMPAPVAVGQGGAQSLSQLVSNNSSKAQMIAQEQAQRAQKRNALLNRGFA